VSTNLGWLSHVLPRSSRAGLTLLAITGMEPMPLVRGMGNLIVYDDCIVFVRLKWRDAFLASLSGNRRDDRVDRLADDQAKLAPDELVSRNPRSWIVRYQEVARARYSNGSWGDPGLAASLGSGTVKTPMESLSIEPIGGSTRRLLRGTSVRGQGKDLLALALDEKLTVVGWNARWK
jgi:hypothetical protein